MIVYVACLTVGIVFAIISAISAHFFGGHDHGGLGTAGHAEAGFDHSGIPGISFFSPTVLACFITAFGAAGMILSKIEVTKNPWISAPISIVAGLGVAGAAFFVFNAMFKQMQGSSELRISSVRGMTASIITPIPADGVGEIAYVHGGSRYTAPARSENGEAIGSGRTVTITRVVGTQYFVEKTTT